MGLLGSSERVQAGFGGGVWSTVSQAEHVCSVSVSVSVQCALHYTLHYTLPLAVEARVETSLGRNTTRR